MIDRDDMSAVNMLNGIAIVVMVILMVVHMPKLMSMIMVPRRFEHAGVRHACHQCEQPYPEHHPDGGA